MGGMPAVRRATCALLVAGLLPAAAASAAASGRAAVVKHGAPERPALNLEFGCEMHVGEGYGHDGDGCMLANGVLSLSPVKSHVWFDATHGRIAQTNPGLLKTVTQNVTLIGRYDETPPIEQQLLAAVSGDGKPTCQQQDIPPAYCRNGSRSCPPSFGTWGGLNAFTGILGMYYTNTSLLAGASTADADVWQWEEVTPTRMPNGSTIAVTRNYTYTVGTKKGEDGTRPLLSFQWTQSIPLRPALPVHRDCFIFDYSTSYVRGPVPVTRFEPPKGVKCDAGSTAVSSQAKNAPSISAAVAPLAAVAPRAYACPNYDTIRQHSVDPPSAGGTFDIRQIAGVWYLMATTEPTTRFCLCNVMNYSFMVEKSEYRYTDTCFQDLSKNGTHNNQTIPLGGDLSKDPETPGVFEEGFVIAGHAVAKKPNMLFDLARDPATGKVTRMHFYACLGKTPPVIGKPLFSYLLYTREAMVSRDDIEKLVAPDRALGVFDMSGLVVTNGSDWATCGVL